MKQLAPGVVAAPAGSLAFLAALILGALTPLGFAPFYLFFIPCLTAAGLCALWLELPGARRGFMLGFAFGLGLFGVGVSWVFVSLHDFGGMPASLAAFATFLFCAVLALFPALTGLVQAGWRVPATIKALLVIPALWVLFEWLRGWAFTGFPWLALGYAQIPASPLAGFAPLLGIYGVSLATMIVAGALALCISRALPRGDAYPHLQGQALQAGRFRSALQSGAIVAALLSIGFAFKHVNWTEPTGALLSVSLLQGNITQDIKWQEQTAASTLETYRELVLATPSRLMVLPETALPLFLHEVPHAYLEELAAHAKHNGGDLLIGVPESPGPDAYYNSVISLGTAHSQTYRKAHLVPFSEFIPLKPLIGWVYDDLLHMPLADFTAGDLEQKPLTIAGQKIAITNCYEDLFGEQVIRQLPQATLLVNVSNDAWFGRSLGPQQHLQISQARALETGRWMLRATNTGVTAFIDSSGRVVSRAPEFVTTALTGQAQGLQGSTAYVRWGNYAVLGCVAALLLLALVLTGRRRETTTPSFGCERN